MSASGSKFGLTLRKKDQPAEPPKPKAAIFNVDSDEEEAKEDQSAAAKFQRKYAQQEKSADKRMVEKLMAEDPSIFDYDSQYEQMQKLRDQKVAEQKEADKEKKPKYAHKLVEAHKKRELEKLLHDERTYKKEREQEAGDFDDSEVFITGAYRKQIEERNQFRVELEQQDKMDEMRDVKNQGMWQQAFQRKMLESRARDYVEPDEMKTELKAEDDGGSAVKMEMETKEQGEEEVKEELMEEPEEEEVEPERKRRRKNSQEDENDEGEEEEDDGRPESGGERRRQERTERHSRDRSGREGKKGGHKEKSHRHAAGEQPKRRTASIGSDTSSHDSRHKSHSEAEKPTAAPTARDEKAKKTAAAAMLAPPVLDDLTEEVRRMEVIRQILRQRNDKAAVEEARQRYLVRRAQGEIVPPF